MNELTTLFSQYGVEAFLQSTSLLVTLLDQDGKLLSWNPAFGLFKQTRREQMHLRHFLVASSEATFDELFSTALDQRVRTKGELEFVGETRNDCFMCIFIPMPAERIVFIAEPVNLASMLEAITAELQSAKRILSVKETELKAVIAQADEVSHTDSLTYLPNRKQIIGDLQREVIFSDHYGTPLTISMLDVDYFKQINDTYGHAVGDDVLRRLASEMRDHIRYPDTIGRYGGDEFLIVLPHSTLKAAAQQAERLCKHIRSLQIRHGDQEIPTAISVGVAQYKTHQEDWQTLLTRADSALYQAKDNGRNQWAVSEE